MLNIYFVLFYLLQNVRYFAVHPNFVVKSSFFGSALIPCGTEIIYQHVDCTRRRFCSPAYPQRTRPPASLPPYIYVICALKNWAPSLLIFFPLLLFCSLLVYALHYLFNEFCLLASSSSRPTIESFVCVSMSLTHAIAAGILWMANAVYDTRYTHTITPRQQVKC